MPKKIKAIIFDWGDTLMRDFPELQGPMYLWEQNELIEGVSELLDAISGKYELCVATNAGDSNTESMIKALERVNIAHYFQYSFSSNDLGYKKPDVKFFTSICKHIGVLPENCVMIGNLYDKDIIGAKEAGMMTVFFNEKKLKGDFEKADHIVFRMEEINEILLPFVDQ
jgi:putative hydrolase of the HAD superfamily